MKRTHQQPKDKMQQAEAPKEEKHDPELKQKEKELDEKIHSDKSPLEHKLEYMTENQSSNSNSAHTTNIPAQPGDMHIPQPTQYTQPMPGHSDASHLPPPPLVATQQPYPQPAYPAQAYPQQPYQQNPQQQAYPQPGAYPEGQHFQQPNPASHQQDPFTTISNPQYDPYSHSPPRMESLPRPQSPRTAHYPQANAPVHDQHQQYASPPQHTQQPPQPVVAPIYGEHPQLNSDEPGPCLPGEPGHHDQSVHQQQVPGPQLPGEHNNQPTVKHDKHDKHEKHEAEKEEEPSKVAKLLGKAKVEGGILAQKITEKYPQLEVKGNELKSEVERQYHEYAAKKEREAEQERLATQVQQTEEERKKSQKEKKKQAKIDEKNARKLAKQRARDAEKGKVEPEHKEGPVQGPHMQGPSPIPQAQV